MSNSKDSHVHVLRGNPSEAEYAAISQVFAGIAERAEDARNVKPHPRGFHGSRAAHFGHVLSLNPGAFRNPDLRHLS